METSTFYKFGFYRVACIVPDTLVADVTKNTDVLIAELDKIKDKSPDLVVFPELSLTSYTCADIFYQKKIRTQVVDGLRKIVEKSKNYSFTFTIGLPWEHNNRLYNCAAIISNGELLGLVPKTYIPNTNEYYELRWFCSGKDLNTTTNFLGNDIPFSTQTLFRDKRHPSLVFGVEICEDLWAVVPPSSDMALAGAQLIVNLSASNELIGKSNYRRELVKQQAARCLAAYAYCSAGPNESTTDVVFSGHSLISENGQILDETKILEFDSQYIVSDIDIEKLENERLRNSPFMQASATRDYKTIEIADNSANINKGDYARTPTQRPFIPSNAEDKFRHCKDIIEIQSSGLCKRLRHIGGPSIVLGLSGGLDSTLALLIAVHAVDKIKLDRTKIIAVNMPGFGTTDRTKNNAMTLAEHLGVTLKNIPIGEAVKIHLKDIEHDISLEDITYENAQARERTQILMDLSNKYGGIVLGTGDLSEQALGWSTYNGDHMSMYNVNSSIPKTLVRHLVEWFAQNEFKNDVSKILIDICETPISPELLPPSADGEILQNTEEKVGPYELHDFFLFNIFRNQFSAEKINFLANKAFKDVYSEKVIGKWLKEFLRRYISQQFKRSCVPDGPKVGSVSLSPRGDLRMPTDAVINWEL